MTGNETETPEQQIARLKRELEFLQNKFQIVGSITRHDILNQMTAIMGYNELLLTMVQDEKVVGFLEIQRRASDKIRRIFAYSKVYGNIGAEPPRWQKLDALVHLACDAAKLGTVAVTTDPDLKSCSLLLDTQAVQVFAYLFDNSVLHGKRVTTIRISLLQQGDGPVLVVGDDGEGIPAAEKEKIFAKGFGKRTGWGLFVAREILAATGMAIRETGVPGTGARFEIAIPPDHIRLAGEKP
jgi:signal transduction histidine kinase